MKFIGGFIFHIFSNAIALLAATYWIPQFTFNGDFIALLITATALTALHTFIRPIVKLFLGPFIVLTFGFFIVIINAATLYFLDIWSNALTIQGYIPLIWGTLLISAVNIIIAFAGKRVFKD